MKISPNYFSAEYVKKLFKKASKKITPEYKNFLEETLKKAKTNFFWVFKLSEIIGYSSCLGSKVSKL